METNRQEVMEMDMWKELRRIRRNISLSALLNALRFARLRLERIEDEELRKTLTKCISKLMTEKYPKVDKWGTEKSDYRSQLYFCVCEVLNTQHLKNDFMRHAKLFLKEVKELGDQIYHDQDGAYMAVFHATSVWCRRWLVFKLITRKLCNYEDCHNILEEMSFLANSALTQQAQIFPNDFKRKSTCECECGEVDFVTMRTMRTMGSQDYEKMLDLCRKATAHFRESLKYKNRVRPVLCLLHLLGYYLRFSSNIVTAERDALKEAFVEFGPSFNNFLDRYIWLSPHKFAAREWPDHENFNEDPFLLIPLKGVLLWLNTVWEDKYKVSTEKLKNSRKTPTGDRDTQGFNFALLDESEDVEEEEEEKVEKIGKEDSNEDVREDFNHDEVYFSAYLILSQKAFPFSESILQRPSSQQFHSILLSLRRSNLKDYQNTFPNFRREFEDLKTVMELKPADCSLHLTSCTLHSCQDSLPHLAFLWTNRDKWISAYQQAEALPTQRKNDTKNVILLDEYGMQGLLKLQLAWFEGTLQQCEDGKFEVIIENEENVVKSLAYPLRQIYLKEKDLADLKNGQRCRFYLGAGYWFQEKNEGLKIMAIACLVSSSEKHFSGEFSSSEQDDGGESSSSGKIYSGKSSSSEQHGSGESSSSGQHYSGESLTEIDELNVAMTRSLYEQRGDN